MTARSLPTDKLIGSVLADRYEIMQRLGEGAMGTVYRARHVKIGRSFAVKILHARLLADPKLAQRFAREAELAGRLRHPNVVGVVDLGEVDALGGLRYMVMELAEGPDLAHLLVEAPMPAERIIALVRQLLDGLDHAHGHGLIHRDFKPENIIIERNSAGAEVPRIVDFGIALLREGGDSSDGRLTTNGLVLGTPHYMAPEQAVADPIDHRIDLFALGIVIYEMLSGRLPFDGSGAEVARANLLLEPPPIAQRVPHLDVDPLLEAFALRLMAKVRDARPPTAKAARELLDLIARDRAAAAAALGVPAASVRGPASTQTIAAEEHRDAHAWEVPAARPAPPTTKMTPTRPRAPATDDVAALSHAAPAPTAARSEAITGAALGRREPMPAGVPLPLSSQPLPWSAPRDEPAFPDASQPLPLVGAPRALEAPPMLAAPAMLATRPRLDAPPLLDAAGPASAADAAAPSIEREPASTEDYSPLDPTPGRRKRWLVLGGLGAAAGVLAVWLLAAARAPDQPTRTAAGQTTTPPIAAAPTPTERAVPPPLPAAEPAVAPRQPESPGANEPTRAGPASEVAASHPRGRTAHGPPAQAAARPERRAAGEARQDAGDRPHVELEPARPAVPHVEHVEPAAAPQRETTPAPGVQGGPGTPAMTSVSPRQLSELYTAVGQELRQLPKTAVEDLWSQWYLFDSQELMRGSQEARDAAARKLLQIRSAAAKRATAD